MKTGVIGVVVGLVVMGATYWLCANAHIDIFPCTRVYQDRSYFGAPLVEHSGTCSLLSHNRGRRDGGEYDELTVEGWGALAALCLGAGALAGVGAGLGVRARVWVS